jgi:hypothetical protein
VFTLSQPSGGEDAELAKIQKIDRGVSAAKCVVVGGIFLVGGIAVFVTQGPWLAGLLGILYGGWVLSGAFTGGWRLLIY